MDTRLFYSCRARSGRARSALRELDIGNREWLVPKEWLRDALETRVLELEYDIVVLVGVRDE